MLSVKEFAERSGASPSSLRVWLADPQQREKRLPCAELVRPDYGVPYWLIPESVLDGFELFKPGPKPSKKKASKGKQ